MNTSEWLIMSRLQHTDSAQRIHKHCSEEWVTYTGALCSCSIIHDMYMNNGSNNWEKPTDIFKIDSSADYFHNSSFSLEISTCLSKWRLHSRQSKTQRLFIHCQKWWTKAANPHSHEAGQQRLNFSLDWRIDDINVRLQDETGKYLLLSKTCSYEYLTYLFLMSVTRSDSCWWKSHKIKLGYFHTTYIYFPCCRFNGDKTRGSSFLLPPGGQKTMNTFSGSDDVETYRSEYSVRGFTGTWCYCVSITSSC